MSTGMDLINGKISCDGKTLADHLIDPNNFTHAAYKFQIAEAQKKGYSFDGYNDAATSDKSIILRHDEPFSPTASLAIARINSDLGVKGTFFFDPSNEFYSLVSDKVQSIIVEIKQLGQDIALKVNPKNEAGEFPSDDAPNVENGKTKEEKLDHKIKQNKEELTELTGIEPNVYALDVTGLKDAGFDIPTGEIAGMTSAYGHQFADGKLRTYNSNSNGIHPYGTSFLDEVKNGKNLLHVLVHPCWISPTAMLPNDRLNYWLENKPTKKVLKELKSFKDLVHNGGRVIIGDGHKPDIDLAAKMIMTPKNCPSPPFAPSIKNN